MMGRVAHYFQKSALKIKKEGLGAFCTEMGSFLWKRKFFLEFFFEFLEYQISSRFRDIHATLIKSLKNSEIKSDRVLLYVSFDSESHIREHVVQQLRAFQAQKYEIIFVSASPEFSSVEFEKIKDLTTICLHRKNEGYDFASWKLAQTFIDSKMGVLKSLILMNDSCLGPAYDLSETLRKMQNAPQAVFGVSKSEEIAEHIQSYFYHFGSDVLSTDFAKRFFERIRILHTKWGIVRYLEIGSSRFLSQAGIPLHGLIDPVNDPVIKEKMRAFGLTEPTREPLASEWVKLKLSPFYKRSAGNLKISSD